MIGYGNGFYLDQLSVMRSLVEKLGEDFKSCKDTSKDDSEFWKTHKELLDSIKFLEDRVD